MIISCMVLHNILVDVKDTTALEESIDIRSLDLDTTAKYPIEGEDIDKANNDDLEREMGKLASRDLQRLFL